MEKISERLKFDIGLVGQTLNNSNVTGKYHSMSGWERAVAILICGALAATKTCALQIMEAEDADGTNAAAISGKLATITANTLVTELTVALAAAANTDTVTINGLVFTMAAATDASAREFQNAAGLKICVEDETYGVAGIEASVNGTDVTLLADPLGDTLLTVVGGNVAGTVVVATTKAIAFCELENYSLSSGDSHLAAKVTSTGNGIVSVALIRGRFKKAVAQKVGASA